MRTPLSMSSLSLAHYQTSAKVPPPPLSLENSRTVSSSSLTLPRPPDDIPRSFYENIPKERKDSLSSGVLADLNIGPPPSFAPPLPPGKPKWLNHFTKTERNCRNGRKLSLYEETNFFSGRTGNSVINFLWKDAGQNIHQARHVSQPKYYKLTIWPFYLSSGLWLEKAHYNGNWEIINPWILPL